MTDRDFAIIGARILLADPNASDEWKQAARDLLDAEKCPDCGGQLYRTTCDVSEPYAENGLIWAGRELPRRIRKDVVALACSGCEYIVEEKEEKR